VQTVTLAANPVERSTDFVATVKSRRSTTIQPQAEGFLTNIRVTSGERVSPGDVLFEIDAQSQQAAVASLESVRAAREADAALARQQLDRAKAMLDVGAMSLQEYEQAQAAQKAAEAQLRSIEDQIRQQRAELAYYRVAAPTAGIVGDVPVRVGDRVTRSTVLTTVADNSGVEVYVNVPVPQAPQLKPGLPVRVLDDQNQVGATTRVGFISPTVDDATQTVLVKAPVNQQAGAFRSDQFVRVRLIWSYEPAITVPVVAVSRINGRYFAFVAEPADGGMVARQRPLEVGPVVGDSYIVRSGLSAGDRLILGGTQKIGDGAPVQPQEGPPPGGPPGGAPEGASGGSQ
jgi:RND family efflux transporter MFP subunit